MLESESRDFIACSKLSEISKTAWDRLMSKNSADMLTTSIENFKNKVVGAPIDINKINKLLAKD